MALDKNQVMVGTLDQTNTIGAALWAAASSNPTLPTLAQMNVTQGYTGLGYLVEDGFSIDFGNESEVIKEHNLGTIRAIKTGGTAVITLTLMQTNADNMKVMLGNDAVTTSAASTTHGAQFMAGFGPDSVGAEGVLQIRLKDGDRAAVILMPHAVVQNFSEVEVAASDAIGWEVEFTGLVDESNKSVYLLHDDGQKTD